jgi:hypothetical protein
MANSSLKTPEQIYNVYVLQSENVRYLGKVKKNQLPELNCCIKKKDDFGLKAKTTMFALLYSAWSESQFVQIQNTPNAFFPREIEDIQSETRSHGIVAGWVMLIDIAFSKVGDIDKSSDLQIRHESILKRIKEIIEQESIIRNKIAHGQWVNALNRKQSDESPITERIDELDYVKIDRLFEIHKLLGVILRDLVQSPKNGFHQNYWQDSQKLLDYAEKTKNHSVEDKRTLLDKRPNNWINKKTRKVFIPST